MTEAQLQAAIVELARLLGWLAYHPFDSRHSAAGYPDLTLTRNGRLVFAELKTETGKLSDAQASWRDALNKAACDFYIWRPSRWLDGTIERVLR